ncbi:MAG: YggS family pyridoxal phosphate-dependent enzyme [Magnetococcales bacterium]|nr:YggS family pyridoxal phosphate-dependent enzyme [Magnetococcales bacterium]
MSLTASIRAIHNRMIAACQRCQRDPDNVRLVAVTKTLPASVVAEAVACGLRLFGENRVQEARDKIAELANPALEWHLIGTLQRNKAREAAALFNMVHSVDSIPLAQELHRCVVASGRATPLPILLQVNVGGESQKHGFATMEVAAAVTAVRALSGLDLRGLMTVPPYLEESEAVRPHFRELARLARRLEQETPGLRLAELSMGMSHDFEVAIEEGATLIRVGSALFGARHYP